MVVNQARPYKVVVVGGSYAGLSFVQNLIFLTEGKPLSAPLRLGSPDIPENAHIKRGVQIVMVDERDGFFHTFGSPLAHVARAYVRPMWRRYQSVKWLKRPDVQVRQLSLRRIEPQQRRAIFKVVKSGEEISEDYDYLVLATGLRRDWPIVPQTQNSEPYVKAAEKHVASIENAKNQSITIVGGGAVGIEFAGEIKNHHPSHKVVLIHSKDQLLSNEPLPDEFKEKTLEVLKEEGVEVMLGQRPDIITDKTGERILQFKDGTESRPGFIVDATTKWTPATEYLPIEALDPLGYVKIQPNLTLPSDIPNAERHFAIGDMVLNSGIKRAGGAMAQGRVTAVNVFCSLLREENPSYELKPATFPGGMPPMMALAVGTQAILYGPANGLQWGVEKMIDTFKDDLGWSYMLRFLEMTEVDEE